MLSVLLKNLLKIPMIQKYLKNLLKAPLAYLKNNFHYQIYKKQQSANKKFLTT